MTSIPIKRIPTYNQDILAETQAWQEHKALLLALRHAPTLADRPEFTSLRMDAFERFSNAFGGAV